MMMEPGCLYLRAEPATGGRTTLTLIGWDNKPHWKVTTTLQQRMVKGWVRMAKSTSAALSPDGRIFALGEVVGGTIQVASYRDGQLLGVASVPWTPIPNRQFSMQAIVATDSGRIWVHNVIVTQQDDIFDLWAIEGNRVAGGSYKASFSGRNCSISPGGTHLMAQNGTAMDYVTLAVQGNQVQATRVYSQPVINEHLTWLDDTRLRGSHGQSGQPPSDITILGPSGVLEQGPLEDVRYSDYSTPDKTDRVPLALKLYDLTSNRSWLLKPAGEPKHEFGYTPDRRTVLVQEQGRSPRLAIYTAPGVLCAELPCKTLPAIIGNPGLSPDGHRAAYLTKVGERKYEIRLYEWGQK
ncbi:MAG: hypothetical protein ACYC7E_09185 [Armatimonadota bacterium]